jgi:NAD(P)-dependent dehydrogenase (short-subunit alcohol dehydrogenase family)
VSGNGTSPEEPRVVVVTGGTAGVGRAAVRAFAERGDDVAILARGVDGLEAARAEVEARGRRALAIAVDVADYDQVEAAARRVEEELGPIDVWVNNAMTTVFAPLWEITPEEYERATRVTYLGSVWGTMVALSRFRERNRGVLVQVGSALAYRAIPLQAPYCGAKHAVRGMIDALRSELIHEGLDGIHVTMVHLPGLNTPQFELCRSRLPNHPQPVPPIYQPEVAADAIVWASVHRRREVMVGVPTVKTVWGQKIAPRFMDRYLASKAWEGQQTADPVPSDRPDNLFEPVAGDHGAHGLFDPGAREASVQLALSKRRRWWAAGAALALAGVAVGLMRR